MVGSFADVSAVRPAGTTVLEVPPGPDDDLLVAVLDEVIYRLDADGESRRWTAEVQPGRRTAGSTARLRPRATRRCRPGRSAPFPRRSPYTTLRVGADPEDRRVVLHGDDRRLDPRTAAPRTAAPGRPGPPPVRPRGEAQPFTTPTGTRRAILRPRPARSAASITADTSL